jgi:hypothetical protein
MTGNRANSSLDMLLMLLYSPGYSGKTNESIRGITKLEKLLFLLKNEDNFGKSLEKYDFRPDNFGPCSIEVYDDLSALEGMSLIKRDVIPIKAFVEVGDLFEIEKEVVDSNDAPPVVDGKTVDIFSLSEKGEKVGQVLINRLSPEERKKIESLKSVYNKMPLNRLLAYVYATYPEQTVNSIIKDRF